MIWIVGEYAERIDNADELLESFLEGFHDESTQVSCPRAECSGQLSQSGVLRSVVPERSGQLSQSGALRSVVPER